MKIAIRYYTRSGNTRKLADAMAKAICTQALDLSAPLTEKTDILLLGCSYYAFDIDAAVKEYIEANKDRIGKIICFGTSAMMKSMKKPVAKVAQAAGITVAEEEFHCRGQFGMLHKGRPNAEDETAAAAFAEKILKDHQ